MSSEYELLERAAESLEEYRTVEAAIMEHLAKLAGAEDERRQADAALSEVLAEELLTDAPVAAAAGARAKTAEKQKTVAEIARYVTALRGRLLRTANRCLRPYQELSAMLPAIEGQLRAELESEWTEAARQFSIVMGRRRAFEELVGHIDLPEPSPIEVPDSMQISPGHSYVQQFAGLTSQFVVDGELATLFTQGTPAPEGALEAGKKLKAEFESVAAGDWQRRNAKAKTEQEAAWAREDAEREAAKAGRWA